MLSLFMLLYVDANFGGMKITQSKTKQCYLKKKDKHSNALYISLATI